MRHYNGSGDLHEDLYERRRRRQAKNWLLAAVFVLAIFATWMINESRHYSSDDAMVKRGCTKLESRYIGSSSGKKSQIWEC